MNKEQEQLSAALKTVGDTLQTLLSYCYDQQESSNHEILADVSIVEMQAAQLVVDSFLSDKLAAKLLRGLLVNVTHENASAPNSQAEFAAELATEAGFSDDIAEVLHDAVFELTSTLVGDPPNYI